MNDILNAAPAPLETPQCWYGPDMASRPELWTHKLAPEEVAEIETAAARLEDVPILELAREPLPKLAERLARIRQEVLHGIGFQVIRGLPVGRWPLKRAAGAFWLIGMHLGEAVSQNGKGHVLGHVRDLDLDYGPAGDARLPDECAPSLPHRRVGSRLPALPQHGARGRAVVAGEFRHDLERDGPAPARPRGGALPTARPHPLGRGAGGQAALGGGAGLPAVAG